MKRHETADDQRRGIAHIQVPEGWSAEQAILVLDFLEHLMDAVWFMHEEQIAMFIQKREPAAADGGRPANGNAEHCG